MALLWRSPKLIPVRCINKYTDATSGPIIPKGVPYNEAVPISKASTPYLEAVSASTGRTPK